MTNEKGIRSYVYILKFFEKVSHSEIKETTTENNIANPEEKNLNHLNMNMNINRSTINSSTDKILYFPVAICLWSHISNTEFFKEILQEIYEIVSLKRLDMNIFSFANFQLIINEGENSCVNSISLNQVVRDYQHCELINYFIFLTGIVKPSSYTRMTLNLSKKINFQKFRKIH